MRSNGQRLAAGDTYPMLPPPSEAEKRARQATLLDKNDLDYRGNGPAATGGSDGWVMREDLYFRCTSCGYFMSADPSEYDACFCGRMYKDADAGRFGSSLGDDAIEVYRAVPHRR
jgi:hypothetical protein